MGKLEVIFNIQLAYPVLHMSAAEPPAVVYFTDTGNTVRLEVPEQGIARVVLHVERECTDEQGKDTSVENADHLRINRDAARAFWQLFDAIREAALPRTVFMYPVVPSEDIRFNPLVRGFDSEWIYEGACLERVKMGKNMPAIEITSDKWAAAVKRLSEGKLVPIYIRFALDAIYFAEHDPQRGIIMACAAWETALRYYLANVASKRDPAYLLASKLTGIPRLYEFAKAARGGPLFFDSIDNATGLERKGLESFRRRMEKLGGVRNKLLHEGEMELTEMAATDHALAVLSAIEWLFAGS
jgi:hypothetical protein